MSYNGILRKKPSVADAGEARQVDLLVFGYACKYYRNDEKALEIDQGKHLIDWMGDPSLKIDRYDVRGALYELASHEPPPGGYGNRLDYLSAEEQRAEQLCEEERYLYLYNNEEDHILQQEEELKRLQQESSGAIYNQVGFQYGNDAGVVQGPQQDGANSPTNDEAEQPFQLPNNFEVPASLQLPETMKQHAIIEKTARFIASQGVQMEILLKAKQSNNVQFEFLNQNSSLNEYYKFMVNAIKNGNYPAEEQEKKETPATPTADGGTDATLNAQLDSVNVPKPVITVPTIKYKPSANCAYTQLISKIKGVPLPQVLQENDNASSTSSPTSVHSNSDRFTPVLLQYNGNTFMTAEEDNSNSNSNSMSRPLSEESKVEILKNSSALALAQGYSSGSDEENDEKDSAAAAPKAPSPVLNFPVPTDNLKNIIDKTATYVIKNGRQFEETLRTKSEERFTFLLTDNEFYPYYMYKITGDPDAASKEQKTRKAAAVAAALLSKKGLKSDKTISPVSFSIKPKDELPTGVLPALPQENSDDEEEKQKGNEKRSVPESVQKAIQLVESQLMAKNAQMSVFSGVGTATTGRVTASNNGTRSRFDVKSDLDRNAIYEQQQQNRQKELRKAEEKVKDKLAQRAREKLCGMLSKEKQLQLERKRKAMAFLNQIKETSSSTGKSPDKNSPSAKGNDAGENASEDSDGSVHSIPITSYGPEGKTDDEEETPLPYILQLPLQVAQQAVKLQKSAENVASHLDKNNKEATQTVLLSDDDDVQLISEDKLSQRLIAKRTIDCREKINSRSSQHKRRRKHRSRSRSSSRSVSVSSRASISSHAHERHKERSHKSKSKSKKSSSKSSHRHNRDKSRKSSRKSSSRHHRSRSRTRSRSRESVPHRYSRSRHSRSYSVESSVSSSSRRRHEERSSHSKSSRRKERSHKYDH